MELVNAFYIRVTAALFRNNIVRLLMIVVCADMVFGTLRAIKDRCTNSSIGIDGAIRKAGMVASVVLFTIMDVIMKVNLMHWLPIEIHSAMNSVGILKAGVTELFAILYILYEVISVLKNMLLCGLPIPAGIREKLSNLLCEWTDETMPNMTDTADAEAGMLAVHLDEKQLSEMKMEDLVEIATTWGIATEQETRESLIKKIMDERVYI